MKKMAARKADAVKKYKIEVVSNREYCGIDAGGVQFAHGEAIIDNPVMAAWFSEHEGYRVTSITKAEATSEEA